MAEAKRRIAYLGGSFDPPHRGHTALADAVIGLALADEVWLAPAYAPPHKSRRISPFADRLAMVRLACCGHRGVLACGIEGELALEPSYTVQVLAELVKKYPDCIFSLLIGADMLAGFHSWHCAGEILEKYRLIVYPRRGEAVDFASLSRYWSRSEVEKLRGALLEPLPFVDISSTNIRTILENGGNAANSIDEAVGEYIKTAGLYRHGEVN